MGGAPASITARHLGGDRLEIAARGHRLRADQPLEAGGEDTGLTPTEIFLGGLAGCVAFYGARYLRRHGLPAEGLEVTCDYSWAAEPTRVGAITLRVEAPGLPPERREAFSRVIEHCSVHNTLRRPPGVRIEVAAGEPAAGGLTGAPMG